MCDVKLQNPFQTQELSIDEKTTTKKIGIPYKDLTTSEDISLYSGLTNQTNWIGKVSFSIVGDICDRKDYVEGNGILKIDKLKTGPYETKGGIIQFRRLYFNFKEMEIPIKVRFKYDKDKLCTTDDSSKPLQTAITSDISGGTQDISGGTRDISGSWDISGVNLIVKVNTTPDSPVKFKEYVVTNGDNETNTNQLMNNLEPLFRKSDSEFIPFYDALVGSTYKLTLEKNIEAEFKKVICGPKKSNDEVVKSSYTLYQQKINHLKELNIYSVIRSKYH